MYHPASSNSLFCRERMNKHPHFYDPIKVGHSCIIWNPCLPGRNSPSFSLFSLGVKQKCTLWDPSSKWEAHAWITRYFQSGSCNEIQCMYCDDSRCVGVEMPHQCIPKPSKPYYSDRGSATSHMYWLLAFVQCCKSLKDTGRYSYLSSAQVWCETIFSSLCVSKRSFNACCMFN